MSYPNKELTEMLNELERKYERAIRAARQTGYSEGNRDGRAGMKQTIIETLDQQLADREFEKQSSPHSFWMLSAYSHRSLGTIKEYIKSFT